VNAQVIEEKLNRYFVLDEEVQTHESNRPTTEFNSLGKELIAMLGIAPESGYEQIVRAAWGVINDARYKEELQEHRAWLGKFDPAHLQSWEKILKDNPDAAKCEMRARRLLEENGNIVEPNLDLKGNKRTPDFRCMQGTQKFFVEVTCIDTERVTNETALPPNPEAGKAFHFGNLNKVIFQEVIAKTPQCSNLEHPALVAVGLFHQQASAICPHKRFMEQLLTGRESITSYLGASGKPFLSTALEQAAFIKPHKTTGEVVRARNPVSGILVCGFGCGTPQICGLLHPEPIHNFDRTLLPHISFLRLKEGYEAGLLATESI
jgi:hypothetical protein